MNNNNADSTFKPAFDFFNGSFWGQLAVLTALIEIPTLIARFVLGFESTRDTASTIGRLTMGIRIHHGYIGVLLLLLSLPIGKESLWKKAFLLVGGALLLSDIVHHFVFLWAINGSPEFDLFYPPSS